jgi:hypothetical protein
VHLVTVLADTTTLPAARRGKAAREAVEMAAAPMDIAFPAPAARTCPGYRPSRTRRK